MLIVTSIPAPMTLKSGSADAFVVSILRQHQGELFHNLRFPEIVYVVSVNFKSIYVFHTDFVQISIIKEDKFVIFLELKIASKLLATFSELPFLAMGHS